MKINVSELTPKQLFDISQRNDFKEIFSSLAGRDKRLFLEKVQRQESNPKVTTPKKPIDNTSETKVDQQLPSVGTMAKNLGKAAVDWTKSGFKMSDKEEYDKRMVICRACPYWKELPGSRLIGRCLKCGCTGAKQKIKTSKCPIGKW